MTVPGLEITCPISSLFTLNQISDILQCSLRRNIEKESKRRENGRNEQIEGEMIKSIRKSKGGKMLTKHSVASSSLNIIVQVKSTTR